MGAATTALQSVGNSRQVRLAVLVAILLFGVALAFPRFLTPRNLAASFDDTAILILLALGQMLVIVTRGIDLSTAATVAFCGMCAALLNQAMPSAGVVLPVTVAIVTGAALGGLNGVLVWQLKIPPIVATLGTMAIIRGAVYGLSRGTWVTSNGMSAPFQAAVRYPVFGLTTLSWLAILGVVALAFMLRFSALGRRFYLTGNNPVAAATIGINVGRTQAIAYLISGALGGLCGYLWVARFAVAYTDVALGFELQVIAACVIGGVAIGGGLGTVAGVLLGCLFLGIIKNALPLVGISPFWQQTVSGLVIVTAAVMSARDRSTVRQVLERLPS